ncbi:MAG: hypothetical protein AB1513_06170 [Pseudomonadota bacterium]
MLEYMFFDAALRDRFVQFSQSQGVACRCVDDDLGMIVQVADDLPENIANQMETFYDALLDEQAELIDQTEGALDKHVAAIRYTLPDGRMCMVRLEPDIANRLLASFTLDELQTLFAAVVDSAEHPGEGPLCQS